ncbi:MAG: helix-turn-helix domain-containing protein [Verrucomicrobiaceae bacterium]|nr:MAG: helix-turn-helix domain-containing protein [Verrucomicrobiaceae bacterium]
MDAAAHSLHDPGFAGLEGILRSDGVNPVHAKALWRALHREAETDLHARADFSPPLRSWIERNVGEGKRFFLDVPEVVDETHSSDGLTKKFLLRLRDGQTIETVLMGYDGRQTACVSTQAGCAMGCVFCATGQMGFVRHLRPGEIVAQVNHVRRVLKQYAPGKRLRNLVMMGMGEPLHNYDAVMHALATISDVRGASIGPAKISVSTVGVIPSILRMAEEGRPYNLAVSLHGSTEEERSSLIPVSKRWSLESLIDACRRYGATSGRRIFFGWTLIAGKNDSPETVQDNVPFIVFSVRDPELSLAISADEPVKAVIIEYPFNTLRKECKSHDQHLCGVLKELPPGANWLYLDKSPGVLHHKLLELHGHAARNHADAKILAGQARSLLLEIIRTVLGEHRISEENERQMYVKMDEIKEILSRHLESKLPSLPILAREVAVSESTLKRNFKQVFGTSIYEYYLQSKMEWARHLFHDKSLSVKEVAFRLGYEKPSSFIKIFKRIYHYPPGELKRRQVAH